MQKRSTPKTALYLVLLILGTIGAVSGAMTATYVLAESLPSATIFVGLLTAVLQFLSAVSIGLAATAYYRTGDAQHVGLWLFLGLACVTFAAQDFAFSVLVAELAFRVVMGGVGVGVNFVGVGLLLLSAGVLRLGGAGNELEVPTGRGAS